MKPFASDTKKEAFDENNCSQLSPPDYYRRKQHNIKDISFTLKSLDKK